MGIKIRDSQPYAICTSLKSPHSGANTVGLFPLIVIQPSPESGIW